MAVLTKESAIFYVVPVQSRHYKKSVSRISRSAETQIQAFVTLVIKVILNYKQRHLLPDELPIRL